MIKRLIRLITLYEEQRNKCIAISPMRGRVSSNHPPPLPPRRQTDLESNVPANASDRINNWVSDVPIGAIPRSFSIDSSKEDHGSQARSSTSTRSSVAHGQELKSIESVEELGSFDALQEKMRPRENQREILKEDPKPTSDKDVYGSFDNLQQRSSSEKQTADPVAQRNEEDVYGSFDNLRSGGPSVVERPSETAGSINGNVYGSFENIKTDVKTHLDLYAHLKDEFASVDNLKPKRESKIDSASEGNTMTANSKETTQQL
jgi:hypothetical protein